MELFVRWLDEVRRLKPSTVARRLSVVTCFDLVALQDLVPLAVERTCPAVSRTWSSHLVSWQ